MQWQEYFFDAQTMIETINSRLAAEAALIRYVNLRYRLYGGEETKWLYDVKLTVADETVVITTGDDHVVTIPLTELEYIKLRPFYYAACVGFKALEFYAYPDPKGL